MTENNSEKPQVSEPKKSNKKTTILLIIFAVIIVVQGVKIYLDHQESVERENQLASTEDELATTLQRLNDISEELSEKIRAIDSLGGDITELQEAKDEIERELARSQKASRSTIAALKDKVDGYEILLKAKDKEIDKLKELNTALLTENTTLKTEKNVLFDSLNELNTSKDELASKVALASQLKAENIQILAVNRRGKERESPFKSRHAEKLKVTFNIAENDVAPIEGKNIIVRIVDSNGQIIFDVSRGSGTFMIDGKEEFYTASKEILFDNTKQQLTFEYEKGSEYEEGLYTLEVYTDDYKMGSQQFEVK
ncbi:chromosome segregation protein SMC [Fulvivirga sp. RKSG066]|uniref:coiled-coil domain-containing protein n=1 Tax=Fulvivirga aurantia TaxID=2529383 RepID=UPI0012BC60F3|nr:chromosome segregation protein SMC [Fulvivirga aurantia]MTI21735.1 chromosome segregation protein SMC [Fulvivirga aurantia]